MVFAAALNYSCQVFGALTGSSKRKRSKWDQLRFVAEKPCTVWWHLLVLYGAWRMKNLPFLGQHFGWQRVGWLQLNGMYSPCLGIKGMQILNRTEELGTSCHPGSIPQLVLIDSRGLGSQIQIEGTGSSGTSNCSNCSVLSANDWCLRSWYRTLLLGEICSKVCTTVSLSFAVSVFWIESLAATFTEDLYMQTAMDLWSLWCLDGPYSVSEQNKSFVYIYI